MRAASLSSTVGVVAACGWLIAAVPALAQDVRITAPAPAADDAAPSAESDAAPALTTEESDTLARALSADPAAALEGKAPALKRTGPPAPPGLAVDRNDKADGSSTVALKRPLTIDASDLSSTIGGDVNLAAPAASVYQPGKPLPGAAANDTGSADAWASLGVNNIASLDARVDQASNQGKVAGSLRRSVPVGDMSVTIEDSYSVTDTLNPAPLPATSPAAVQPATAAPPAAAEVFGNAKSVKLAIAPTGTTLGAGITTASNDPETHNTISADQKLVGPLHVTTSVTDIGQPSESKSISAGFKLTW